MTDGALRLALSLPAWTKIAPVVSRKGQRLVLQRILYMSCRYCICLADTVYILQTLYTSRRYCICLAKGEDFYSVCIRLQTSCWAFLFLFLLLQNLEKPCLNSSCSQNRGSQLNLVFELKKKKGLGFI